MLNLFDDEFADGQAKILAAYGFLVPANILTWLWAWIAFAGHPALLGTALLAYMFGLRHAFDADHISAIDSVVRKLMHEGKKPIFVGFFFALGHSTIVMIASVAVAATAALHAHLDSMHRIGGTIGTLVSAIFILAVGIANIFVFTGIWEAFSRARRGEKIAEEHLNSLFAGRGLLARAFRRTFEVVSRSWHMYPVGFLFALGFDTATEIGVLGISATSATQGISLWTILLFPALFTAGMSLMDTTDSVLMTKAYGWAYVNPLRKLWYNLTITAASVMVAVFIGGLEILAILLRKLGLQGGFWDFVDTLNNNLGNIGFLVVGMFVFICSISAAIYKIKGFGQVQPAIS